MPRSGCGISRGARRQLPIRRNRTRVWYSSGCSAWGNAEQRKTSQAMRQEQRRSILDFVLEDVQSMQGDLGARDKLKLDEYLTSVREVEQRIAKAESFKQADPGV